MYKYLMKINKTQHIKINSFKILIIKIRLLKKKYVQEGIKNYNIKYSDFYILS